MTSIPWKLSKGPAGSLMLISYCLPWDLYILHWKVLLSELDLELDQRKNIKVDQKQSTNRQKVFAAGDSVSGATLVVNAIASGRKVAKEIDIFLRKRIK